MHCVIVKLQTICFIVLQYDKMRKNNREEQETWKSISKARNFIIPIIIVVIVLIVASVLGYRYYQEQELQKKIDTAITEIEKMETDLTRKITRRK